MKTGVLPLLLLGLAVSVNAFKSDTGSIIAHRDRSPTCDLCQGLLTTVTTYLSDPHTQNDVRRILESAICTSVPDAMHDTCIAEIGVFYSQVVAMIVSALDPSDVCGALGLCAGSGLAAVEGPFDCPMCRVVALTLLQRFKDPELRKQMQNALLEACGELEPTKQPKCIVDATALFTAVEAVVDDIDPNTACEVTQFCPKPTPPTKVAPASGAAPAFRALWGQLAAIEPGRTNGLASDKACDDCKAIVMQAVAILENPKTQAEILDYAKQSCSIFKDWEDECDQYVTLYGPLILNMVITYIQPNIVCQELGYCVPALAV